jgi:hypothetical protein
MVTIITCIQGILSFDCPLLRSFTDNSGVLIVNKTAGLPVHCQWLIASSLQQVIEFLFMIIFKITFFFDSIEDYYRI